MNKVLPPTFGTLWKGFFSSGKNPPMNTAPLPQTAPIVGTPKTATADLLRQARNKIIKGQNRKLVRNQLLASTARKAAVVVPSPASTARPSPSPVSPASPSPASSPASASFGGAGYSGRSATLLGDASNPGTTTALPKQPKT